MKSRTMHTVLTILVSLSIFVQACSSIGTNSTASSTSRSNFTAETGNETDKLEVKPEMRSNVLRIEKVKLDAGRLGFRLSSPDGQVQWEKSFTAPANYQHTFELDITPGIWILDIELANATGSYNIQWKASD